MKVTTAHILADKALDQPCGQTCVDWAISMLEEGRDGHYLTRLVGMFPPYNHFELTELRDLTLREQGFGELDRSAAVLAFAAERLRLALAGEIDIFRTLEAVKESENVALTCVVRADEDIYFGKWSYKLHLPETSETSDSNPTYVVHTICLFTKVYCLRNKIEVLRSKY
jgi:hypothetical protein